MSAGQRRMRHAVIALASGGMLLLGGFATQLLSSGPGGQDGLSEPALPRLQGQRDEVARIHIETAEENFTLERELEGWVLAERGGYPADTVLANRLILDLEGLELKGERTRDPQRLPVLGLGDPAEAGEGIRISLENRRGRSMGSLLAGQARGRDQIYVRLTDRGPAYLATGALPAIAVSTGWMELDFLALGYDDISRAEITPESGPAYQLARRGVSADRFDLTGADEYQLFSDGAGDGVATTLARVRFRDVRPASQLRGASIATHAVETFRGLRVEMRVYQDGEDLWAVLRAIAISDNEADTAIAINERADGWAFLMSDLMTDRLIRPLEGIARPVTE